jgi:3-oxoacyl-[acyl-carrier-protein] synthase-3
MWNIRVAGTGYYVPDKVLSNKDLEEKLDTSDEWIVKRTGISERRIAEPHQNCSDMALPAARQALKAAGISAQDLDYIIMGTISPDMACPSGACFLEGKLGADKAISFDVAAACSGFVFTLDVGRRFIQTGAQNVLVVASEIMTRMQDWTDRTNCVLWGDGAGAVVLQPGSATPQLLDIYTATDGANGQNLLVPSGGSATTPISYESVDRKAHTLKMIDAANTLKVAVQYFYDAVSTVLQRQGFTFSDVDHFVPHQANIRFMQALARRMNISMDKFIVTINKYGNISGASCIIALAEGVATGRVKAGDLVCMPVFGGGLTWGAALIRF